MRRKINSDLWDSEGFLKDVSLWDEEIARTVASKENIILNGEHWDIIYLVAKVLRESSNSTRQSRPCKFS
jgi:sulfur relay (sulfurtransferase) DsrC/TusE family protein